MSGHATQHKTTAADAHLPAHHPPAANQQTSEADLTKMLDKRDARKTALGQVKDFASFGFDVLKVGANRAIAELEVPDVPKTETTKKLLGELAVAVVSAATGGAAGWIAAGISVVVKEKVASTVKGAVTTAMTKALQSGVATAAAEINDLKSAFARQIDVQCLRAQKRFVNEWPAIEAQLAVLGDEEIAALNRLSKDADPEQAYAAILRSTFVQWANFLARAKHGGMSGWDHWASSGTGSRDAVALAGAQPAPTQVGTADPTRGNVDPTKMDWALEKKQRPMQDEHFGILEVFLDEHTLQLVPHEDYGMRLDNVGPKVREELRNAGRVRDLPVNKLIRVCSYLDNGVRVNPPIAKKTILVTADGFVRSSFGFDRVHFEVKKGPLWDPTGFGECADLLIQGKESASCHVDKVHRAASVTTVAEVAQNLPLTYLKK